MMAVLRLDALEEAGLLFISGLDAVEGFDVLFVFGLAAGEGAVRGVDVVEGVGHLETLPRVGLIEHGVEAFALENGVVGGDDG